MRGFGFEDGHQPVPRLHERLSAFALQRRTHSVDIDTRLGKLGKQLAKVRDLMHTGNDIPVVTPQTPMSDVIYEMSSKKLGMTTVQESGVLRGVISDGDLRRLLEREGGAALSKSAGEAMNATPRTIPSGELAAKALAILEERKITSLVVVDSKGKVEGVVHLHDLWGVELI
jgi:arabinose-5-phosphate isomerase